MTNLWDPLRLRGVTLPHRVVISPMVMYHGTRDGLARDWHLAHYGRFALGGAAMVFVEATAVDPQGRGSYADLGLWDDVHVEPLRRIAALLESLGSVPAIQLQHTGRKGAARRPWDGYRPLDDEDIRLRGEAPWPLVAPSPLAVNDHSQVPEALDQAGMSRIVASYVDAARRADAAGFRLLEVHAAHGYLLHEFLSPISNHRTDAYGGGRESRMRFPLEVVEAVRSVWPADKPLSVRVSSVDGADGGWELEDTVAFAAELAARGVDVVDCSSGGISGSATVARVPRGPGFQVPYAERVRREVGIATIAVGLITTAEHAAQVVADERADLVAIGRQALVEPNWPNLARRELRGDGSWQDWPDETGWWLQKREESLRAVR